MIETKKISLPVEGMTCASCVARVEKTVAKVEGIRNVSVNLATEKVSFDYDPKLVDLKEVAAKVEDAGYKIDIVETKKEEHTETEFKTSNSDYQQELKKDLIFAIIMAIPIVNINMGIMWEGFFLNNHFTAEQINKILLILTTPVIFISGKRFFTIFFKNLKHFTADMNSLVAVGTGSAYIYSLLLTLFPEIFSQHHKISHVYFDTTVVIITLILLGRWLEARAKTKTGTAIKKLMELQPKTALVKENNLEIEKPLSDLKTGDIIIIKPGAKIPADGLIISGTSAIDESMITGESLPVEKIIGSKVIGGTINTNGYFEFEITDIGKNSVLGHIIKLVEDAQGSKAPIQNIADKVASIFVPAVILIAILTFIYWLIFAQSDLSVALINFVAVLIIACPCALGLATPTALIVAMGKAAQNGILFKDGESLEELHRADTIVFDKTGTLTEGKLSIKNIFCDGISEKEFLSVLASIEKRSDHPLAKAVMDYAADKDANYYETEEFENRSGKGLIAKINGKLVLAGNSQLMQENKIGLEKFSKELSDDNIKNTSMIFLAVEKELKGFVTVVDSIKPTSKEVIDGLKKINVTPVLSSGDNESTTKKIAGLAGIEKYFAEVTPQNKLIKIKELQSENKKVVMVGDGINDAPALAQSDIGIAIGTGTDVAIESAGVVLLSGDLKGVLKAIRLSNKTISVIKQNLFWAFIYNVIGIPLAALGMLNPMFAALAMSLSSVSVISNSLRLKSTKL
ncbi:MAG: heavy metal translocating P-type ATPase [Ignavibacteriaceae bacterium]|jgi:Cu+-exporting ATPase|nr:heavy metal translocating P-type ATPase [Ignavibacteriaceae bacterium]